MEVILGLSLPQWAAVFTILGAVFSLFKPVRQMFSRILDRIFITRRMLRQHMQDEDRKLDLIYGEMRPNGSSSMRDAIDRTEQHLQDIDAFLSAQLNIHTVAIVRTDAQGKVIYVNRQYQRTLGVASTEVMGDGWINVIHPDDRERVSSMWKDAVDSKREFNEDIKFIRSDGRTLRGHANVYKEVNKRGQVTGFLGVITFPVTNCIERESCLEQFLEMTHYENPNPTD